MAVKLGNAVKEPIDQGILIDSRMRPTRVSLLPLLRMSTYTAFPAERILLGPGPSPVPQRVLRALGAPTLGHLDPQYLAIMDETCARLREVFRTKNALTFPVSGTGMAGME